MRPNVTVRCAAVAGAALTLAIIVPTAANASTWGVAHPPYTATDNVPYPARAGEYRHRRALTNRRLGRQRRLTDPLQRD